MIAAVVPGVYDAALEKLGDPETLRKAHTQVKHWMLTHKDGHLTEHDVDVSTACTARKAVVHKDEVPSWIKNLVTDSGGFTDPKLKEDVIKAATFAVLSESFVENNHRIHISPAPGGTRYLGAFMLAACRLDANRFLFFAAQYEDVARLTKKWRWLVENHDEKIIKQFLDYELFMKIEDEARRDRELAEVKEKEAKKKKLKQAQGRVPQVELDSDEEWRVRVQVEREVEERRRVRRVVEQELDARRLRELDEARCLKRALHALGCCCCEILSKHVTS